MTSTEIVENNKKHFETIIFNPKYLDPRKFRILVADKRTVTFNSIF